MLFPYSKHLVAIGDPACSLFRFSLRSEFIFAFSSRSNWSEIGIYGIIEFLQIFLPSLFSWAKNLSSLEKLLGSGIPDFRGCCPPYLLLVLFAHKPRTFAARFPFKGFVGSPLLGIFRTVIENVSSGLYEPPIQTTK